MEKIGFKLEGSVIWIVFWTIFFFPIALALLFLNGVFLSNQYKYFFEYKGSTFWLCFWMIIFFPISILLIMINGLNLCKIERS